MNAKERLNNLFNLDENPLNIVMKSIVDRGDEFVDKIYNMIIDSNMQYELGDIFAVFYLSLRNLYDLEPLLNIKYRESRPNTSDIFGADSAILGSMTILIEVINEILIFIAKYRPDKIDKSYEILKNFIGNDTEYTIIINNKNDIEKNFNNIKNKIFKSLELTIIWLKSP
jgi:hypothetical protein